MAAGPSPRQQRAVDLTARIRAFHAASDGTYGAPRIHADLQDSGVVVSRKTVAKLMQADGITGISPRTWHPPTTVQGEDPFPVPDLVQRPFDQGERDIAWFSDITYLHTGEGWAPYVSCGTGTPTVSSGAPWATALHTDLVEDALRQAVALRGRLPRKVIFHDGLTDAGERHHHRVALTGNIQWPRIPISSGPEPQYSGALTPPNTHLCCQSRVGHGSHIPDPARWRGLRTADRGRATSVTVR